MHVCLALVSALLIAPTGGNQVGIAYTLEKANRTAASTSATWNRFDPSSAECESAIDAIMKSGVFEHAVRVAVTNISFEVDSQSGAIALEGIYAGVDRDIIEFFKRDELKPIEAFDAETKTLDWDFRKNRERQREKRENAIEVNHPGLKDNRQYAFRLLKQWVRQTENTRKTLMRERAKQRVRLVADHSSYAKERKKKLETVRIKATIPPALASTIDMAKLKSEKRAVLTLQVRSIGLQEGNDEIAYPVSIGSLAGEAIAIAKTVLKK